MFVNVDPAIGDQPGHGQDAVPARYGELVGAQCRDAAGEAGPARHVPRRGRHHTADLAVTWYGHVVGARRGRRLPGARRPGVERAMLAVANASARSGCTRCRPRWTRCPRSTPWSSATTTTTTSTSTPSSQLANTQRAHVLRARSESARTCASGASPRTASSNSTGTRAHRLGDLTLVCTPARHFSGRLPDPQRHAVVVVGADRSAAPGASSAATPATRKSFADIGSDHGPFDVTLMPVGAYHPGWPDIHMNPEDAVRAHLDVTEPVRVCCCRSTGRRSGSRRTRGPNRSNGCSPRQTPRVSRWSCRARASGSIRDANSSPLIPHRRWTRGGRA